MAEVDNLVAFPGFLAKSGIKAKPADLLSNKEMGEFDSRILQGIIHPESEEEVIKIVRSANEYKIKLYPFSQGKNWGFGSKMPVRRDSFLLDLSSLNEVHKLDLELGHAVIGPGVSQKQLSDLLVGSEYMLNVTASGCQASIVGNALDRGVGYIRQRTGDIAGFTVVTGKGDLVKTGSFWSTGNPQFNYPNGIGPGLTQLFFQSNFGVITAAAIILVPRPEQLRLINLVFPDRNLAAVLSSLQSLYRQNMLLGIGKIYDRSEEGFELFAAIGGSDDTITCLTDSVNQRLKGLGKLSVLNREEANSSPMPTYQDQFNLFDGKPSDFSLKGYVFKPGDENKLDEYAILGLRLLCPIVPWKYQDVQSAIGIIRSHQKKHGTDIKFTLNLLSPGTIDFVIYLEFARNDQGIQSTNQLHDTMLQAFYQAGYFPYRLDIDHQNPQKTYVDPAYLSLIKEIKQSFDPLDIIASGRYT